MLFMVEIRRLRVLARIPDDQRRSGGQIGMREVRAGKKENEADHAEVKG